MPILAGPGGSGAPTNLLFPDSGSRQVLYANGDFAVNLTATLYTDEALTTLAEIYGDNGGIPGGRIVTAQITTDAYGRQPDYWGPVAGDDHLWIVVNGGPPSRVDAAYGPRFTAIASAGYETTAGSQTKATAAQVAATGAAAALAIVFGG
jgi:hypothetical protein